MQECRVLEQRRRGQLGRRRRLNARRRRRGRHAGRGGAYSGGCRGQALRGRGGMAAIGCCGLIHWCDFCGDEQSDEHRMNSRYILKHNYIHMNKILLVSRTCCGFVLQGLLSVVHVPGKTVCCHLDWVFLPLFPEANKFCKATAMMLRTWAAVWVCALS